MPGPALNLNSVQDLVLEQDPVQDLVLVVDPDLDPELVKDLVWGWVLVWGPVPDPLVVSALASASGAALASHSSLMLNSTFSPFSGVYVGIWGVLGV